MNRRELDMVLQKFDRCHARCRTTMEAALEAADGDWDRADQLLLWDAERDRRERERLAGCGFL